MSAVSPVLSAVSRRVYAVSAAEMFTVVSYPLPARRQTAGSVRSKMDAKGIPLFSINRILKLLSFIYILVIWQTRIFANRPCFCMPGLPDPGGTWHHQPLLRAGSWERKLSATQQACFLGQDMRMLLPPPTIPPPRPSLAPPPREIVDLEREWTEQRSGDVLVAGTSRCTSCSPPPPVPPSITPPSTPLVRLCI